ncbi:MAG TPA: lantibiotic dehydratase [Pseudonocardiaceae bacterium]|nr:lantibiotic dehydratase [Pseudonocardiaceae bacterium]
MTSARALERAGRSAGLFSVHPTAPILARLPLLPAEGGEDHGNGLLREGMFLASRSLGEDHARSTRARHTVRAYELRARWRPTPHGVFAGVALAGVVDGPACLQMGAGHRARSNPSAVWLAAVCADLLQGPHAPEILVRLALTTQGSAVRRGDRWEVESELADDHDRRGVERCTVRATAATDLIMAVCTGGATTGAILDAVRSRWPQVRESVVLDTVTSLIRYGFLIADLLPGDVSADPIARLLTVLPLTHPTRPPLAGLRDELAVADTHAPGRPERLAALRAGRDLADRIHRVDRPLTVDVALDARIDLPAAVVTDAIRAAEVLWRIAPRHDPTDEFRLRFAERYGHHRYVPLLDAADPVTGIGLLGQQQSGTEDAPGRGAVLSSLIAAAVADRAVEVELDDPTITALTVQDGTPPCTAEVHVRVVADHPHPAGQAGLRAVVTGCASTAGATLTRFASLLGHHHSEPDHGQTLTAGLAVRPRSAAAQTIAPPAGFAPYRIPIGVPRGGEQDLPLEDLLLLCDGGRVMVWSAALDRQVVPVLYARLAPHLLPPLAHLLHLLGQADSQPWHAWSWGAASDGPFQPRIRYRGTILSSARWTLPSALIDTAGNAERWEAELDRWRTHTIPAPPAAVLTDDADRCLPLTLDHDADRELLRRYVRRGVKAVLEPPGGAHAHSAVVTGLHGQHLAELVIPVMRRADPPTHPHRAALPARARGDGLFYPGGPWLSLAIPTAPHLQDELLLRLAERVGDLAEHWDLWFWLRYQTTALGHHLRVRFHGRPDVLGGRLLPAVGRWAQTMSTQRLAGRIIVESYEQETERYGGPGAIEYAEHVFAADSQLVLALLPETADHRIAATAHIAATVARTVADGDRAALAGHHLDRTAHQTMNRLRPGVRAADTTGVGPGDGELFAALHNSLAAYRDALPAHLRTTCASSLIHMHANRARPTAADEPLIRALAADLIARTP